MKILLTGASGQVGQALSGALQPLGDVIALRRAQLDLNDFAMIRQVIRAERPQLIVNCAGYTAVDRAESEAALAHRINGLAPGVIAEEAKRLAAPLIHFSTDYVFDGCKPDPYVESDPPNPINVYGESKLAGEHAIAAAGAAHIILRCSWIYGMHGNNFLRTILDLAKTRAELRVVSDQYGAPTWVGTIASMTRSILAHPGAQDEGWWRDHGGIYHLCSEGRTSWHGFAQAIVPSERIAKAQTK